MVEQTFEAVGLLREPPPEPTPDTVPPSVADALLWPAETASWLTRCPVGPDAVAALAAIDPDSQSKGACLDLLIAAQRVQAWLAAREQHVLAALWVHCHEQPSHDGKEYLRDEVAAALRLSGYHAANRLNVGWALATQLPGTAEALEQGRISYLHARVIVSETETIGDYEARVAIEDQVLEQAERLTVGELRQLVRRIVIAADPDAAERRRKAAYRNRRVTLRPDVAGMAELWALLPADQARALMAALNAMAEQDKEIPDADGHLRTLDQRRADALCDLGKAALSDPRLPRRHGSRPHILVAISLSTLLGCDQQPGQLTGYGPIPADMARRMAADRSGTWQRIIVDEMGRCLDYGRAVYRPPTNLRDFVIARDRLCRFPGCTKPAVESDLDHHRPWAEGGRTDADNVGPLCARHHQMKHEAGWQIRRLHDGTTRWISPDGRHYDRDPDPYPVDDWTWSPPSEDKDRDSLDVPWQPDYSAAPSAGHDPPPF